ncbi:hypothetical protein [Streptomyces sp. NBC_01217]|uniref:hypothetical protein n=1 Tax=Streptomyces sp. NBC_01217 TaxID=2903779 RepID=UPI002E150CD1|nr:hypothetical protein OG507_06260 [Streptomyces sp. NBC_01217]
MPTHGPADDNVAVARMLGFSAALAAAGRSHTAPPLSGAGLPVSQWETVSSPLLLERDFHRKSLSR